MSARPPAKRRATKRPTKVTPARWVAWQAISRTFDDDAWTDRAFAQLVERYELDGRERAFAQRLAYGTVQQAKRLDHVIQTLGKRPLRKLDPPVLHALRIGMYELLVLGAEREGAGDEIVPGGASAHAAVSQAVELVRGVVGERAVAFTNAILRRAQVDGANILGRLDLSDDEDLATSLSMPTWLVQHARANHGEDGVAALAAQNEPFSHTMFRVNETIAGTLDKAVAEQLMEEGVQLATPPFFRAAPQALAVGGSTAPLSALIASGAVVPQSLASQLVTAALDPQPGEAVLDMCAAPGGKATHIASLVLPGGRVTALELHEHRADSIQALADKLGLDNIDVYVGDATDVDASREGAFDHVLLDAPCSGSGVLAARPDSRWKRTEESIAELAELQGRLLASAARLVRPGGVVLYSTCSILDAEDEAIVARAAEYGLEPDPLPELFPEELRIDDWRARTWPHKHDTEGFFIARMRRRGADA